MYPTPDVSGHDTMFRFHQAPPVRAPAGPQQRWWIAAPVTSDSSRAVQHNGLSEPRRAGTEWRRRGDQGPLRADQQKHKDLKLFALQKLLIFFRIKDYTFENNLNISHMFNWWTVFTDCLNATEIDYQNLIELLAAPGRGEMGLWSLWLLAQQRDFHWRHWCLGPIWL